MSPSALKTSVFPLTIRFGLNSSLGALADTKSLRPLFHSLCTFLVFVSSLNPVQHLPSHLTCSRAHSQPDGSHRGPHNKSQSLSHTGRRLSQILCGLCQVCLVVEVSGQKDQLLEQCCKTFDVSLAMTQREVCLWKAAFPTK